LASAAGAEVSSVTSPLLSGASELSEASALVSAALLSAALLSAALLAVVAGAVVVPDPVSVSLLHALINRAAAPAMATYPTVLRLDAALILGGLLKALGRRL